MACRSALAASLVASASAAWPAAGHLTLQGVDDYQAAAAQLPFPATDDSLMNLTGYFTVPAKPTTWDGQTQVYLWFGVNWYNSQGTCMGVMQPVLTYGCSPNAFSGVGCGTDTSDPHYSDDPYWYLSSQYVVGWGPGQAFGSKEMIKTAPGSRIYNEVSYHAEKNQWHVFARDESTGATSTFEIPHPMQDPSLDWRTYHADPGTQATLYAVSEPHQVSDASSQMPPIHNFEFSVDGKTSSLPWSGGQGSARVVQQGQGGSLTLVDMDLAWEGTAKTDITV